MLTNKAVKFVRKLTGSLLRSSRLLRRYASKERALKSILSVLLFVFSSLTYAIGSREITRDNIEEFGGEIEIKYTKFSECFDILASFSNRINFKELGQREIWRASFEKTNNDSGWQLASKGTRIKVPLIENGDNHKLGSVCLNQQDLESGYITVVYGGPQGTPPMVLVFKLNEYK